MPTRGQERPVRGCAQTASTTTSTVASTTTTEVVSEVIAFNDEKSPTDVEGQDLAKTGSDSMAAAAIGFILLGAGVLIALLRRRRSSL